MTLTCIVVSLQVRCVARPGAGRTDRPGRGRCRSGVRVSRAGSTPSRGAPAPREDLGVDGLNRRGFGRIGPALVGPGRDEALDESSIEELAHQVSGRDPREVGFAAVGALVRSGHVSSPGAWARAAIGPGPTGLPAVPRFGPTRPGRADGMRMDGRVS